MNILYLALKYDYGVQEQGYSFEHYNFFDSLRNMGHNILYFDFMTLIQKHGQEWMNQRLLDIVKAKKPDLMFTVLFRDEINPAVLREISVNSNTITLNWFCDDHWRFDNFSRYWAPYFNWVVTTAKSSLPKYASMSYRNVIKSQWACNHFLYRNMGLPLKYDVTFVGQPHGNRRAIIQGLQNAGINTKAWGSQWEDGRLSQEEMICVFNQSRINLNLSNSSVSIPGLIDTAKNYAVALTSKALNVVPFGSMVKELGKQWLLSRSKPAPQSDTITPPPSPKANLKFADQIKGRNFEIPGTGGFLLTGQADNLEDYYIDGKEVVCFETLDDLIEKAFYYLKHENERKAIAEAGYKRTLQEHTYAHRFADIFHQIGLENVTKEVFEGKVTPGQVEEID